MNTMSSTEVQTVTPGAEKAKLAGAVLLALGGLVAYYLLAKQGTLAQWGALIGLLLAAVLLFLVSEQGKALIAHGRDSWREARKVVWPTRQETTRTTWVVIAVVILMSLLLAGFDVVIVDSTDPQGPGAALFTDRKSVV